MIPEWMKEVETGPYQVAPLNVGKKKKLCREDALWRSRFLPG